MTCKMAGLLLKPFCLFPSASDREWKRIEWRPTLAGSWVVRAPACTLQGRRSISDQGHIPELQVRSPASVRARAGRSAHRCVSLTSEFLSLSLSPSLPSTLSKKKRGKKINGKNILGRRLTAIKSEDSSHFMNLSKVPVLFQRNDIKIGHV